MSIKKTTALTSRAVGWSNAKSGSHFKANSVFVSDWIWRGGKAANGWKQMQGIDLPKNGIQSTWGQRQIMPNRRSLHLVPFDG